MTGTRAMCGFKLAANHSIRPVSGGVMLSGPAGRLHLTLPGKLAAAISSLEGENFLDEAILPGANATDVAGDALQQLARLGAVERVAAGPDGPLVVIEPAGETYRLRRSERPKPGSIIRLSRFACLRADDGAMVLESPLCHSRARLVNPALAAILACLSQPTEMDAILRPNATTLGGEALETALALLIAEDFVSRCTEEGEAETDCDPALRQWEFHDLMFHTRVRFGRHRQPIGGTYRFRGRIPPLPAVKPAMSQVRVHLPKPDLDETSARDVSLTDAIERRRSVRSYGGRPIGLAELGEFLYRVGRVRRVLTIDGVELSSRPYPNGGASYEFELYLLVDRCQELLPGLFHYDPAAHQLEPLTPANATTDQFLSDAYTFCGGNTKPEILILISARFQRVSWKYAGIAYATILKNVGALYQTMYLVATSMGLGPCALGSGNSDRFTELLQEDYYTETAVGEFMLGRPRDG